MIRDQWFGLLNIINVGEIFSDPTIEQGRGPKKKIRTLELKASGHSLEVDSPSIWIVFILGILHPHDTRSIRMKLRKLSYGLT